MGVGYARVSTVDQKTDLQLDALRHAGCEKTFTECASDARDDHPDLARAMALYLKPTVDCP